MIDPTLTKLLFLIPAVLATYGLLRWRLMRATQNFRVSSACEAIDLLDRHDLPAVARKVLEAQIQWAFDGTLPWKILMGAIYFAATPARFRRWKNRPVFPSPELESRYFLVSGKLGAANLATSPIAALLLGVLLVIYLLAVASLFRVRFMLSAVAEWLLGGGDDRSGIRKGAH